MNFIVSLCSTALLAVAVATNAFARPLDSSALALKVKEKIESSLFEIDGVNGVGITGCNPKTGAFDIVGPFVNCVMINTETHSAYSQLVKKFPQGTKIDGVYITVRYVGTIRPQ